MARHHAASIFGRAFGRLAPAGVRSTGYGRAELLQDLLAGLAVAIMLVPQAMAYALLAGLPPIHGLYAATVPAIIYALLGTSRHLSVGPPALMALLTFTGVSAIAEPGSGEYVTLALMLTLMAGLVQLGLGLVRMGFITNFISHPVLSGFVHASVIVIALSQLGHLLGIPLASTHSTTDIAVQLARTITEANLYAVAISAACLAVLVFSRRIARIPGPLIVAVGSTTLVYLLDLEARGVSVVGDVPQGLPDLSVPAIDLAALGDLAPAALTVGFVGFIESISVAKAIAANGKYKINSNQELRTLGIANVGASFFSGLPVAGSFSRTAMNYRSGARTQLSSIATALLVLATLVFLTPFFHHMPHAALAAIIVTAVAGLVDPHQIRRAFAISKLDGAAFLVTFVLTLLVGVEEGIIIGAAFALLSFVRRTAYPDITELGYAEAEDAFLGLRSNPGARTFPEALILRFDAPLYYANVPILEEWLISAVADKPRLAYIIVDCRGVDSVDVTAIDGLEDLVSSYHSRGVAVLFTHAKRPVRECFRRAGWHEKFGGVLYPTTREALRMTGALGRKESAPQSFAGPHSTEGALGDASQRDHPPRRS